MKRTGLLGLMAAVASMGMGTGGKVVECDRPTFSSAPKSKGSSRPKKPRMGNIRRAARSRAARMCYLNIRKDRRLTSYRVKNGSKYNVQFEVAR